MLVPLRKVIGWSVRKLLQLDRPVPLHTEAELAAEVERNYRWNFVANVGDSAIFWFGVSFISSSTVVPFFISKLTDSTFPIGLAAVLAQGGWFLPQLFTSPMVERLARQKPVVVNLGLVLERLPVWFLVVSAAIAASRPAFALPLFLVAYAWYSLGAGIIAASWQDLIARCFPVDRRGRFFGTAMFIGAGTAAGGAAFSTRILGTYPFPHNFVYAFLIAAVSLALGWLCVAATREPPRPVPARRSSREFWASLPNVVRGDQNYRRFLEARLLLALGGMGWGFVTVAAVRRWQLPDGTVGLFTAALLAGQMVGNLSFGLVADRFGHKRNLEVGALAAGVAFALAWLAPSPGWQYLVFALLGIESSAALVSGTLVVLEFSSAERLPTYVGLANTAVGLVSIAAPLLGAWLAAFSYSWLFGLSSVINLGALIAMRWWVREPRHLSTQAG